MHCSLLVTWEQPADTHTHAPFHTPIFPQIFRHPTRAIMSQRAGHGADKASRQCWECVKRRLVCDFTLPHCRKCTKNGKECPGYGDQKPVQWVQIGKVTSRRRRKESPSTAQLNAKIRTQSRSPRASSVADKSVENSEYIRKLADEFDNVIFKYRLDGNVQEVFSNTSRRAIEKALAGHKRSRNVKPPGAPVDPLDRLALALKVMNMERIPAYELRSETNEVVESIEYCMFETPPLTLPAHPPLSIPASSRCGRSLARMRG